MKWLKAVRRKQYTLVCLWQMLRATQNPGHSRIEPISLNCKNSDKGIKRKDKVF